MSHDTLSDDARLKGHSADILHGADEIALFLFGDRSLRRRVYHWCENYDLPVFKIGSSLVARKSTLLTWLSEKECRLSGP